MNKTTEALKLADKVISRYLNETPIGNQPHMICHIADEALAAIREALTEPVCQTCNGLGVIGGFVNMDSGYQDDPCPDCVEPVKQEPVAAILAFYEDEREPRLLSWNRLPNGEHRLYTHPQNLRCKSNQARLATLWGYVKAEPLTDEEILKLAYPLRWDEVDDFEADRAINFAQVIERAHGIEGQA